MVASPGHPIFRSAASAAEQLLIATRTRTGQDMLKEVLVQRNRPLIMAAQITAVVEAPLVVKGEKLPLKRFLSKTLLSVNPDSSVTPVIVENFDEGVRIHG